MPSATQATKATTIQIAPEASPRRFLAAQAAFYRGDPCFVAPIPALEAWQVDKRGPFFGHGDAEFWLARRGDRIVGRISAARDRLHDELHEDRVGFFGHFEATDEAVAHALLEHARAWLEKHGARTLRGPIDLSTNYKVGLLVSGEPGPPGLMMPYNPPTYAAWLESFGQKKEKDVLAVLVRRETLTRERTTRLAARLLERSAARLRALDVRRFWSEVETLWQLYNSIWEKNWGFAPMTRGEFVRQAKDLKGILLPDLAIVAEIDGAPVGFVIGLPDITAALLRCKGSLLPFGWWHLLRAPRRALGMRVLTLGVLPEHRKLGLDVLLLHGIVEAAWQRGIETCECSWILEDNELMLRPLLGLGGKEFRRYRVYAG